VLTRLMFSVPLIGIGWFWLTWMLRLNGVVAVTGGDGTVTFWPFTFTWVPDGTLPSSRVAVACWLTPKMVLFGGAITLDRPSITRLANGMLLSWTDWPRTDVLNGPSMDRFVAVRGSNCGDLEPKCSGAGSRRSYEMLLEQREGIILAHPHFRCRPDAEADRNEHIKGTISCMSTRFLVQIAAFPAAGRACR